MVKKLEKIFIKNKSAYFNFEILEKYTAGILLTGTEIKSIRSNQVNLKDGFCYFKKGELYARNVHIAEYSFGNISNHDPMRIRKLLLNKRELKKILSKITEKGFTLIPLSIFINERGFAKMEIGIAKGKKTHDKRQTIKERDNKKALQTILKYRS